MSEPVRQQRRFLCLWLPRMAMDRAARLQPALRDHPAAIVQPDHDRLMIMAANHAAELSGVAPGQGLSDGRTLCPALKAVDADRAADHRLLERLAESCGRYTPWVGDDPATPPFEGGLVLDITGCAHLFGGEAALLRDLTGRLGALGFQARAAIADTLGAAWAWSRFGDVENHPLIPSGETRPMIEPLPVAGLRLPAATVEVLDRLGLRRIRDLLPLPRATLAARFGILPGRRLDQALGREAEPVNPRRPVVPHEIRRSFNEALQQPEAVAGMLERMLPSLIARLENDGLGARRLTLALFRVDGSLAEASVGTSRPLRDPALILRLFGPKLELLDPDPGVEGMALSAPRTAPFDHHQTRTTDGTGDTHSAAARNWRPGPSLGGLIDRLSNRFSPARVVFVAPRETALPEQQAEARPALDHPLPEGWSGWRRNDRPLTRGEQPVRLLARPEAIESGTAVALLPPRRFAWRGHAVTLRHVSGPDRRAGPWWLENEMPPRDYYRVEDDAGRRLWMYRCLQTGRWFVQGLFA